MGEEINLRFAALMKDIHEWSVKNFGETHWAFQILGVMEELGEYVEASEGKEDKKKQNDAIDDMFIFLLDAYYKLVPTLHGIAPFDLHLDAILEKASAESWGYTFPDLLADYTIANDWAKLSKATLKTVQGIRRKEGVELLAKKIMGLFGIAIAYYGTLDHLYDNVMITWTTQVKVRDWVRFPDTGLASTSSVTQAGLPKSLPSEGKEV